MRRGALKCAWKTHGPGIRPENLERVFERFYTDRPEQSFGKNSGLGLAISRQIVEAHKGRIWAENREGRAAADGVTPGAGGPLHRAPALLAADWDDRLPAHDALQHSRHHGCDWMRGADHGILIRGKPGSGKSELALRLIDTAGLGAARRPCGPRLVADDQTLLRVRRRAGCMAAPPEALAGLMELRGQGLLQLPYLASAPVALVVDLRDGHEIERMPEERLLRDGNCRCVTCRASPWTGPSRPPRRMIRMVLTARLLASCGDIARRGAIGVKSGTFA